MSDALLIVAAAGGLVAGLYYAVRLSEWVRERVRPISVEIVEHSIGSIFRPGHHMLLIEIRFYNPRPRPYLVVEAYLSPQYGKLGSFVLRPVEQDRSFADWRFESNGPIELPAKRHRQLMLGHSTGDAAKWPAAVWQKNVVIIKLDDGSRIVSRPFDWDTRLLQLILEP